MSTYLYSSLNANNSCYCYDAKGSQFSKIGKNSATKISSPSVENGGFLHTYFTNILQFTVYTYIFFFSTHCNYCSLHHTILCVLGWTLWVQGAKRARWSILNPKKRQIWEENSNSDTHMLKYPLAWAKKRTCVHIYFDFCNCNYFSIFEAHYEGRAQSKPLNSL